MGDSEMMWDTMTTEERVNAIEAAAKAFEALGEGPGKDGEMFKEYAEKLWASAEDIQAGRTSAPPKLN